MRSILSIAAMLLVLSCSIAAALEPVEFRAGLLRLNATQRTKEVEREFTALRRILDIQGIPYRVLQPGGSIDRYQTVFVVGSLVDTETTPQEINLLYDYVERRGVVVAAGLIGRRLYPLFGVKTYAPSRQRYRLTFAGRNKVLRYIDRPEERTISLGNGPRHIYDDVIWTHGYGPGERTQQLGTFDDAQGGFLSNPYGRGTAYLLGISYFDAVMRPQIGQDYEAQRKFVNAFEPSADVVMLILKAIYQTHTRPFVIRSAIPYAGPTALILSHDVDAQTSFVDSLKFARLEREFGVTSTFFETTKVFSDATDIDYYNIEENIDAIRTLKEMGADIGSHSVSHAKEFGHLPEGEATVTIADYQPAVRKTVYGEVVVSKALLDRDIPGQNTVSFRAGDLAFPPNLIEVLERSDYLYDSTFAANDVLSAFPYVAFRNREVGSEESNIVEIPVTLDDSLSFLAADTLEEAIGTWIDVITANMENGGISVLLIHPSDTREQDYKLRAQRAVMRFVRDRNGWMGNIAEFGEFVRHRAAGDLAIFRKPDGGIVVRVDTAGTDPMVGFVLGNGPVDASRLVIEQDRSRGHPYQVVAEDGAYRITTSP